MSTHVIHAPGVAALRRWGLLDAGGRHRLPADRDLLVRLRAVHDRRDAAPVATASRRRTRRAAPCSTRSSSTPPPTRAPRSASASPSTRSSSRTARSSASAATTTAARACSSGARVVIGADGRNSRVGQGRPAPRSTTTSRCSSGATTRTGATCRSTASRSSSAPIAAGPRSPTNDGLTMLVVGWPYAEADAYKADVEANYLKTLELAPEFAERVRGADTRGAASPAASVPNFFRTAVRAGLGARRRRRLQQGPDHRPGHHRRVPRRRAVRRRPRRGVQRRAPVRRRDGALPARRATHACCRSTSFTTQLATLEPPPPEMQQLLGAVHGNREAMDAFVSVTAGTVSPVEFFDPDNIGRLMGAVQV